MSPRAKFSLALLSAAAFWTGCAGTRTVPNSSHLVSPRMLLEATNVRRLLDSGIQLQARGQYALSQQTLSAALSELSLVDTQGVGESVHSLGQQVLGAMKNNLPYSLEPEESEDALSGEEDGVAILDSLVTDSLGPVVLDSATQSELRREVLLDSATKFDLPIEINDMVLMNLRLFKDRIPQHFARWLERKGRWEAAMTKELAAHGLPKDLLYLAMIESGFNPRATSPAAAAGIWQFIPGTGRRFGLRIDRFVDERRDPAKSTQAAIAYLSILYQQFGDWKLAMAAYNCGEWCIERAVRRSGTNNYWDLPIPRETKNYVPRVFAAAILGKHPKTHGFDIEPWAPVLFDTFTVEGGLTFTQIGKAIGVPEDSLGLLNPSLVRGTTPPAHENWLLNLPLGSRERFSTAYADLERSYQAPQPQRTVHKVRRKETLAGIASRYGVSVSDIKRWNKIKGRKVRAGRALVIYGDYPGSGGGILKEPPLAKRGEGIPKGGRQASHKVRRGESLASIARRYGVGIEDLKEWNAISNKVKPGHRIWVSAPPKEEVAAIHEAQEATSGSSPPSTAKTSEPVVAAPAPVVPAKTVSVAKPEPVAIDLSQSIRHRVRRGETMAAIALRYTVTVEQIQGWNGLSGTKVRPGSHLRIGGAAEPPVVAATPAPPKKAVKAAVAPAQPPAGVHVVRQGETLDEIAHRYAISSTSIKLLNRLHSSRINIGQKLVIPGGAKMAAPPVATKVAGPKPRMITYVVREGDSLYSIALSRATTVDTLMELNGLTRPDLKPGQVLQIPLASAQ